MANSQAVSFGSRLDTDSVGTRHVGSWALCNLNLWTGSLHGAHSPSWCLWGCFLDSQEPSPTGPNLVCFLILTLQELCGQSMLSSELSCHQGLKTAFPPKRSLGDLDNIWGVPWHACFLLCYWRMAQVTNPRVRLYSCETVLEGRARILHFNSHFLSVHAHGHEHTHVALSLSLFLILP